jgi:hypothetical protein
MGFDLTNERIQDTYEQLLQISGSTIVDGTGSVAPVSIESASYADFAVTASYAENAGDIDTSSLTPLSTFNAYTSSNDATFTSYTSSNDSEIVTINTKIDSLEAGSGSADWPLITNKPSGLVSSSAQSVANLEGGDIVANTIRLDKSFGNIISSSALILGKFGTSTIITAQSGQEYLTMQLSGGATKYEQSANSHTFTGNITGSNQTLSGNLSVGGDLVVNGTASFAVIESITGSAKIIGDAYIILNNNTPTERYAGIVVQDSGSTNNTASLEFDGQTNDWFYEYTDDGGATAEFGAVMFGPGYNTKGSHVYPSNNTILKGTGDHHIVDSNITDDGTSVTVSTSLTASAFKGDGSALTNIPSTLGNGSGGNLSIVTQNVTSNDATSAAQGGIAIGDTSQITGAGSTDAVAIGRDSSVINAQRGVALGYAAGSSGNTAIAIGDRADAGQTDSIAIGKQASAGAENAIVIGDGPSGGGQDSIVIGRDSAADFNGAIVVGANAFAQANQSIAVGINSSAGGDEAIAIGKGAGSSGNNAISLGDGPSAGGTDSIVIGRDGAADFQDAIAIGRGTTAQANSAIGIGANLSLTTANEINIGGKFKYDGTDITLDATTVSSSGNFLVEGQLSSPTFAGSVASSTSSIDFDNGNFATLTLSAATFLANPSNLKSGTTYTIIFEQSGSHVSGYGDAFLFAGGTEPTLSDGKDVLTMVSDGTNLFATALTNFS